MSQEEGSGSAGPGLLSVRYGIPAALIAVGLGFLLLGPDTIKLEAWVTLTGAGLSVLLLNALYRVGVSGDVQRDREAEAREYFDRHGEWPEEDANEEATGANGRRWRLPEGVATPETEAAEARRKAADAALHGDAQGDL